VLVNNAGITGPVRDPHDYTADDMTEVLLTNVVGYLRLIHAFLQAFLPHHLRDSLGARGPQS
jgi:NAD(P)-dependent dehydrogenase (short-subunit alcohol dehydrogenase family)